MASDGRILLVDDDSELRGILMSLLEPGGFQVAGAADGFEALDQAAAAPFEVAVVDLVLPGISGLETIRRLKQISPDTRIVVLTGNPSVDTAIGALREHIFDYLCKPRDIGRLRDVVREAARSTKGTTAPLGTAGPVPEDGGRAGRMASAGRLVTQDAACTLVGAGQAMERIRHLIAKVAPTGLTVLIRGETGTGKEVVARNIHARSGRAAGHFTKINCPAVPDHLLESEMFGHEKGAFTGAATQRVGRFEQAAGGTILLDEIGAITLSAQSKLLEAVEQKEFMRLGGEGKIRVDARILAATNAPLEELIEKGQFRADLVYRLQQFEIHIPPLREHREDIPELARFILAKYAARFRKEPPELPPETVARLCGFDWPGNVRQLDATLSQFCITDDIEAVERVINPDGASSGARAAPVLEQCEAGAIRAALAQANGNQRRAAELLGISYSALRRRIAKYGGMCSLF
jgi:DNA-binding NtrC family response regulator